MLFLIVCYMSCQLINIGNINILIIVIILSKIDYRLRIRPKINMTTIEWVILLMIFIHIYSFSIHGLGRFDNMWWVYIEINEVVGVFGGFVGLWLVKGVRKCLEVFSNGGLMWVYKVKQGWLFDWNLFRVIVTILTLSAYQIHFNRWLLSWWILLSSINLSI